MDAPSLGDPMWATLQEESQGQVPELSAPPQASGTVCALRKSLNLFGLSFSLLQHGGNNIAPSFLPGFL